VATVLDPHFASDWRVLFNEHYGSLFPESGALPDQRGEVHIKRVLKNLCFFEHQVMTAAADAPAAAAPAAAAAADVEMHGVEGGGDDLEMDVVLDQPVAQLGRSLRLKLNSLKKRPAPAPGLTPPPAVAHAKQNAPVQPWMEEVDRFFTHYIIPKRFTSETAPRDPLYMWVKLYGEFPLLARVAQRIFSCTATSADAERVFSLAGLIATSGRASLKPERLMQLVFLSLTLRYRYEDVQRRAERRAAVARL
jgi:hypothetical protein